MCQSVCWVTGDLGCVQPAEVILRKRHIALGVELGLWEEVHVSPTICHPIDFGSNLSTKPDFLHIQHDGCNETNLTVLL